MYVNQSITRPVGINSFGSCLLRAEPDYASVRFSVPRSAAEPVGAFTDARVGANAARKVLTEAGVGAANVRVSQLGVEPRYEGDYNNKRFAGYVSSAGFIVQVRDLAKLERLLQDLVQSSGSLIENVSFKTHRVRELRELARQGAVRSARKKAEGLASAAGARAGALLHLEEVNPDELSRRSHAPDIDLAEHNDEAASGDEATGSIVIAAAVMACFAVIAG